jgi:hypothetical protein
MTAAVDWSQPIPVTPEMLRQAKGARPGQWIYSVDPQFGPNDGCPPWAIRGGYQVGPQGQIDTSTWTYNPNYRPGPRTQGWPEPTNALETALELAACKYGPEWDLLAALLDAEVIVPTVPGDPGSLSIVSSADDRPVIVIYTSRRRLTNHVRSYQTVPFTGLTAALRGATVKINPGSPPSVDIPGDEIVDALRRRAESGRAPGQ